MNQAPDFVVRGSTIIEGLVIAFFGMFLIYISERLRDQSGNRAIEKEERIRQLKVRCLRAEMAAEALLEQPQDPVRERVTEVLIEQPQREPSIFSGSVESQWRKMCFTMDEIKKQDAPILPLPRPVIVDTEANEDEVTCVICFVNIKTCCAVPCGHKIVCNACSREAEFDTCPICRAKCTNVMRVYD